MSRQASAPRLPERDTTPIRPARKSLPLNAGMMPTKHSPGVTRPALSGPTTQQPLARAAAMIAAAHRDELGQHDQRPGARLDGVERRGPGGKRRDEHDGSIEADVVHRGARTKGKHAL